MPFSLQYTIRPARAGDLGSMVMLLSELFSIEADFCPDEQRQRNGLAMLLDKQSAQDGQAAQDGRILVAEVEGDPVAMCTGQLVVSTAEGGYSVLVEDLVVRRDHRRRGIGQALLRALEQWGRECGASRLQLLADRENLPAMKFYEQTGWAATRLVCLRTGLETGSSTGNSRTTSRKAS